MTDRHASRCLRLLLTGFLVLVGWGIVGSVEDGARSEDPTSETVARSAGARLASTRLSPAPPPVPLLGVAPLPVEDFGVERRGISSPEPRTPLRGRPADPARLPRAPPHPRSL